jgi:hypothetical protein
MKKKIILMILLGSSFIVNAQQKKAFTFIKANIQTLEKKALYNDDGMSGKLFSTPLLKKRMLGMFLVNEDGSYDYETSKYITFSSILPTDKFEVKEFGKDENDFEGNMSIINLKTKQTYIVMIYPMMNFQDYSKYANEEMGNGYIFKVCPKELTTDEKALIIKYKALIKSANSNIAVLTSIQKKYLTRGYFDTERVSTIDKKNYNKNLDDLKSKAEQLADIDRYEDKDNVAEEKLTISELGSISNINDWNTNQFKLN